MKKRIPRLFTKYRPYDFRRLDCASLPRSPEHGDIPNTLNNLFSLQTTACGVLIYSEIT